MNGRTFPFREFWTLTDRRSWFSLDKSMSCASSMLTYSFFFLRDKQADSRFLIIRICFFMFRSSTSSCTVVCFGLLLFSGAIWMRLFGTLMAVTIGWGFILMVEAPFTVVTLLGETNFKTFASLAGIAVTTAPPVVATVCGLLFSTSDL